MLAIILRTIKDKQKSLIIYIIAGMLFMLMYVTLFPSMQQSFDELAKTMLKQMPEGFLKAFGVDVSTFGTFEGFIASEYFSFIWPLVAILIGVSFAGSSLAGEIEKGTMEILLAQPISRIKLFFSKYLAGLFNILAYILITVLAIFPTAALLDISFKSENFIKLLGLGSLFGLAVYSIAIFFSVIFNEKGKAYFAASGVLLSMYVLNIISALKENLDKLKYISFFHYYNPSKLLVHGQIIDYSVYVFLGTAIVLLPISIFYFQKKDISA